MARGCGQVKVHSLFLYANKACKCYLQINSINLNSINFKYYDIITIFKIYSKSCFV